MAEVSVLNIGKWIKENKKFFLPPVCNKMMHNKQLKVMFIGGPNSRKDYHHEEGEELFYMVKGDMCLKVIERGMHRDIVIKEGEIFLLPARIPHSPQRQEGTVGMVIERERLETEMDGLRYYVGDTTEPLFERWFHCYDLGTELVPIIKEYFESEEYKTGNPNPEKLMKDLPFAIDEETILTKPFSLNEWLQKNDCLKGCKQLFNAHYQFNIKVYFEGEFELPRRSVEHWIWQIEGDSTMIIGQNSHSLTKGDSLLLPVDICATWKCAAGSRALCVTQDGLKDEA